MEQREQRYMLAWYLCRVVTEFAESKPRVSYAESRRKWAKAKDGNTLKDPHDGHEMTAEV